MTITVRNMFIDALAPPPNIPGLRFGGGNENVTSTARGIRNIVSLSHVGYHVRPSK